MTKIQLTDTQIAAWKSAAESVMHHPATSMDIHCHAYATYVLAGALQEQQKTNQEKDNLIAELKASLSEWEDCEHDGATWYDYSGRERCGKCGADV